MGKSAAVISLPISIKNVPVSVQLYGTLLHNLWVMPFVNASEKMSMISVRAVIAFCDRNGVSLSLFNNGGGRSSPSVSDDCDWLQESKETETE